MLSVVFQVENLRKFVFDLYILIEGYLDIFIK